MKTLFIFTLIFASTSFAQKNTNVSTSGGRFQLIQLSDFRRDQFLLDTQTGKIWKKVCTIPEGNECELGAWMQDDVIGITITEAEYYKKVREVRKMIEEEKSAPQPKAK